MNKPINFAAVRITGILSDGAVKNCGWQITDFNHSLNEDGTRLSVRVVVNKVASVSSDDMRRINDAAADRWLKLVSWRVWDSRVSQYHTDTGTQLIDLNFEWMEAANE